MQKVQEFNEKIRSEKTVPDFRAGDIVKVHRKIKEGNKERVQVFEGIVISVKGKQSSSPMLTVRRVSHGIGTEIIVPAYSPTIEKIEITKRARTRKAKLYYLRRKDFKLSKLKMKELDQFVAKEPVEENIEETKPELKEDAKEEGAKNEKEEQSD